MSKLEKLKERARALEAKDTKAAIDSWLEVLDAQEDESDPNPDLAIFNRIGDLYLKLKDPGQAADYYDRAVDRYAELGFHNNAIAMCNKVLRNAPGRPSTYLKLAKLYAAKGFTGEARQNFIEYAERMQKAGNIQQAFQALKEFVDLSPEGEQLRQMLEEHLRAHGGPDLQAKLAATPAPKPGSAPPAAPKVAKRKTTCLVFLDLDEPAKAKTPLPGRPSGGPVRPTMAPPVSAPPVAKAPPPPAPPPPPPPAARPVAGALETTSLGDEVVSEPVDHLDGLQITNTDFDQVRESVRDVEPLRQENLVGDAEPIEGLEPTAPAAEEQAAPEPIDLPLVEAFEVGVPDSEIEEEPSLPVQELVPPVE